MTDGEIFVARMAITVDNQSISDTVLQRPTELLGKFPPVDFDIVQSNFIFVTGNNTVNKSAVVIIGRKKTWLL